MKSKKQHIHTCPDCKTTYRCNCTDLATVATVRDVNGSQHICPQMVRNSRDDVDWQEPGNITSSNNKRESTRMPVFYTDVALTLPLETVHQLSILFNFECLKGATQQAVAKQLIKQLSTVLHTISCDKVRRERPDLVEAALPEIEKIAYIFQKVNCDEL